MLDYVHLLKEEISHQAPSPGPLTTVFFGGGTPSLLPPHLIQDVLHCLKDRFGLSPAAEVSMEADPGTFDLGRIKGYQDVGVQRFSVGVQAFDEELLKACGRSHTLQDVYKAVEAIQEAGVASWSLDLISGLPHLTPAAWEHSLREAIRLQPDHVSVYDLQVEDKTPFARWYAPGAAPLPTDEASADMYRTASSLLRAAGYEHYEISSYAKSGHRCKHNSVYWQGAPFYAFGLGAASLLQGQRFSRPRTMGAYGDWVLKQGCNIPEPGHDDEDIVEQVLDVIMLRLRTSDGLPLSQVREWFGERHADALQKALQRQEGAGLVSRTNGNRDSAVSYRLTDPEGFLLSNDVMSSCFAAVQKAAVSAK